MKKLFAILAFLILPVAVHAQTRCDTTIKYVENDAATGSPALRALTTAGVGFSVPYTDVNQKAIDAKATAAYITGSPVSLYFSASGVSCSGIAYRTDLLWIHIGGV